VVLTVPMLDRMKIDDVVGAIPVHLFAGIWGTLAVACRTPATGLTQIVGIVAIGAFVFVDLWPSSGPSSRRPWASASSQESEVDGLDKFPNCGMEAYPDFQKG
jgi:Amt family ammonium transporter